MKAPDPTTLGAVMSTIGIMYTEGRVLLPLHVLKTRYYLWPECAGAGRYILSNLVE
jgi:hypothetical protein